MATELTPEETTPKRKWKKKVIYRKNAELDDDHLCEKSNTWIALFSEIAAQFIALDADFAAPFANNWNGKVEAFEKHPTDETMLDDIEDRQQTFRAEIKTLLGLVDKVEYFVKSAFPDDSRILHEFGFSKIRRAAADDKGGKTAVLCYTLILVMADYTAELTTAGMPGGLTGDINSQKDSVAAAYAQLEYGRRLRWRAATQRVKMFNELWKIHQQVKRAAYVIFSDDLTKAQQFD